MGVRYHKRDKCFSAGIYYEGTQKDLGCFATCKEANKAYQKAREARIRQLVADNVYPTLSKYLIQHI